MVGGVDLGAQVPCWGRGVKAAAGPDGRRPEVRGLSRPDLPVSETGGGRGGGGGRVVAAGLGEPRGGGDVR